MKNKLLFCCLSFFILISFIIGGCGFLTEGYNSHDVLSSLVSIKNAELTVSFIDVGQGDAVLVECGDKAMLIDAGLYSERLKVISYLNNRNVKKLDYCVATHPHADHIGGMSEVIYNFDVETLVYPLCEVDSSSWNYVLDACDEKDVSYFNPQPGDTFTLGEAEVTVFSPYKNDVYSDLNDYSLVLKLEYEDVSFIFTGDAESQVEKALIKSGFDLSADVLKCGHHGSSTSSCEEFIDAVNPAAAVISCGKDNEYGHPHTETIDTLKSRNIEIYRTDLSSTIVACSDGETVTFLSGDDVLGEVTANTQTEAQVTATEAAYSYVGNKNSKIFHKSDCSSVSNMKEQNKVYLNTREDAAAKGYTPCKTCNP